jgi:hypothetical protein
VVDGKRYPVYEGPQPCSCGEDATDEDDPNVTGFDVVKRATEGR